MVKEYFFSVVLIEDKTHLKRNLRGNRQMVSFGTQERKYSITP